MFTFSLYSQDYQVFKHKISGKENRATVRACQQSKAGYMLFAIDEGLIRYNGQSEMLYPFPSGYKSFSSLYFDADTGYVGFSDGRMLIFKEGRFEPVKWEEGTPKKEITCIKKDTQGKLWFGTKTEGLYVHDNRYLFHFGIEDGLPDLGINDLVVDDAGNIWAATDRGLAKVRLDDRKKSIITFDKSKGLPDELVTTLSVSNNKVYGGTNSGQIFTLDNTTMSITLLPLDSLHTYAISDIWVDDTELWGLDASGGIFMYAYGRNNEYIYIDSKKISAEGRIRSLVADDEFNIWLTDGTENVMRIFRGILHLTEHENFSLKKISSISCNKNGYVYFSSEDGLLSHPVVFGSRHTMMRILDKNENTSQEIISIYADKQGDVWAGTFGNGLIQFDGKSKKIIRFKETNGFLNDNVLNIAGDGKSVWVATLGGVAYLENGFNGKVKFIGKENDMPVGFNYCVGLDTINKTTFVGSDGGGLIQINRDFSIKVVQGGPSTVYCLSALPGVGVVFSGEQPGLWAYDGEHVVNLSNFFRFGLITPTGLTVLPDSSVVVLHSKGFERFYPFRKSNTSFNESYNIGSFESALNAISVDEYGNCWLASDEELLRLSSISERYRRIPLTILDEILVLSDTVPQTKHSFAYDENSFTFNFSGIWFQDEENVTFSYKLEGIDADWRVTGDHYANYPALPPGKYRFRVKSSATGSFIHPDERVYEFEINQPFWLEMWFYVPALLLVVGIMLIIVRSTNKRIADKERMLKENAEFRFQVLKNQISPHFLFNSFNTLLYLIDSDKRKASDYTEELSDFFRKVLEVREQNLITLREELHLMELYGSLQQTRFENALKIEINVDERYLDTLIPPLSGQMLLENAIKHNSISQSLPLVFKVEVEDAWLVFANNKQLRRGASDSTGIGLKNIIQRYRLLNFADPQIRQDDETFTVLLPLIFS